MRGATATLLFVVLMMTTSKAEPWTNTLSWQADPAATSYRIETSADLGATWQLTVCCLTAPSATLTLGTTGLTLIRLSNCTGPVATPTACVVRTTDGFFHNDAFGP